MSQLHLQFHVLITYALGKSRSWLKCVGHCHPSGGLQGPGPTLASRKWTTNERFLCLPCFSLPFHKSKWFYNSNFLHDKTHTIWTKKIHIHHSWQNIVLKYLHQCKWQEHKQELTELWDLSCMHGNMWSEVGIRMFNTALFTIATD